jgi:anti-sigma regulatory factor (Ser/Thr protein kinase)
MTQQVVEGGEPFVHPALFYQGPWEYLAGTVPFIVEGLAAGAPVAVAVPEARLRLLRDVLGDTAERVQLMDMSVAGRNPGRIIAEVLRATADAHPGKHVRIIGEPIWAGRSDTEYPACVQHEALINLAFTGRTATILCPYDVAALDPVVVADAAATHPVLIQDGTTWSSPDYAPERIIDQYNGALPAPPHATRFAFDAARLRQARRTTAEHAHRAGLDGDRVDDVVLAVGELAANTVRHGGGAGVVHTWTEADHFVCQVHDAGHLTDPLAGRRPADDHQLSGRGLLMVNHLADLVRMHARPDGTTIRAYFHCPTPNSAGSAPTLAEDRRAVASTGSPVG